MHGNMKGIVATAFCRDRMGLLACSKVIAERAGDARSGHLPSGQVNVNGALNEIEKMEDSTDRKAMASAQVRWRRGGLS